MSTNNYEFLMQFSCEFNMAVGYDAHTPCAPANLNNSVDLLSCI